MAISILSDISSWTIVVCIANYSYRLLKYFHGYWQATKFILSNIFNNKIIPDENFPDYCTELMYMCKYTHFMHICLHALLFNTTSVPYNAT